MSDEDKVIPFRPRRRGSPGMRGRQPFTPAGPSGPYGADVPVVETMMSFDEFCQRMGIVREPSMSRYRDGNEKQGMGIGADEYMEFPPDEGWYDVVGMLRDVINDIESGKVKPTICFVGLLEPRGRDANAPVYSMGANRIELLGLLEEWKRNLP